MGWLCKSHADADRDDRLPLPTQLLLNEDFIPPPQSAERNSTRVRDILRVTIR